MENPKRSKPQPECKDRLSELPDSLIFNILWFVPMKDVVRTMILSKGWRNRWTTTPFLNLDMLKGVMDVPNFVNRALLLWNGIRIQKFKVVDTYYRIGNSSYSDTVLWVNFAKDKGVEELYIQFDDASDPFMVPHCLYSCSSLKVLLFDNCEFWIKRNVQWNQLKSLTITQCLGVTEDLISQILSGSPRLEVLNLSFLDRGESLHIESNSLKELLICKSLCRRYDIYIYEALVFSKLTIRTPYLETLKIKGFPYGNCRLIDVSSLTCATIGSYGLNYDERHECDDSDEIGYENSFSSIQDYIGHNFREILQTIQHVESIGLSFCCPEVLRAMKMRCIHSSFPNVKSLKIGYHYERYEQIVGLLDIFPQLERLVLQGKQGYYLQDDPEAVEHEPKLPESFLPQLRTIEVTWEKGDNIFTAVETLLKYASKLEQLVFQVKGILPPNSLLSASKKLMNMPRSSANCKISVFICSRFVNF